jgi:hypothetical protein
MFILLIITVYSLIASFQVRVDLGLPNHKKCAAIAKTVDDVGDRFRPAMGTRWLAYIKKAYGEVAPAAASCEDQGTLVVEDDDC